MADYINKEGLTYDMSAFMAPDLEDEREATKEIYISDKFKDAEGNPVPWVIRRIPISENRDLRNMCMYNQRQRNGVYVKMLNQQKYLSQLVLTSTVFPDLRNVDLLKRWHANDAEEVLDALLTSGEYDDLIEAITEFNGYDPLEKEDESTVEAAKN